jgi:Putative auto-transporter adhesin, head GIN domain
MNRLITFLTASVLVLVGVGADAQTRAYGHFHKVTVSPYIQATFVQGDQESVTINSSIVDNSKLHIEVEHGELRLYLDGAKDIPHNQHGDDYDGKHGYSLYPKHAVLVTVTYKKLDRLSLRGEETFLCESPISQDHFTLRVYGESRVIFTEVHFNKLYTKIFGESRLDIKSGAVNKQFYTCFGEAQINTTAIYGHRAKVTAFGEAEFRMNVADRIKITSFGQARLRYMGSPDIVKGIHFGGVNVAKLD